MDETPEQQGADITYHLPNKVSDSINLHKEMDNALQHNVPNNGGEIQANMDDSAYC